MASARSSTRRTKSDHAPPAAGDSPRRGGRPSLTASAELSERILDAATHLFLAHGYGATSVEAVARRARVSKRTFYHRFEDKPVLFGAVVHRIILRLRPPADAPLLEGGDLESILRGLAGLILRAALSPSAIALHRLIVAESARFPQLAEVVAAEGSTTEAITLIAGLLDRAMRAGSIAPKDPLFAAQQFSAHDHRRATAASDGARARDGAGRGRGLGARCRRSLPQRLPRPGARRRLIRRRPSTSVLRMRFAPHGAGSPCGMSARRRSNSRLTTRGTRRRFCPIPSDNRTWAGLAMGSLRMAYGSRPGHQAFRRVQAPTPGECVRCSRRRPARVGG